MDPAPSFHLSMQPKVIVFILRRRTDRETRINIKYNQAINMRDREDTSFLSGLSARLPFTRHCCFVCVGAALLYLISVLAAAAGCNFGGKEGIPYDGKTLRIVFVSVARSDLADDIMSRQRRCVESMVWWIIIPHNTITHQR